MNPEQTIKKPTDAELAAANAEGDKPIAADAPATKFITALLGEKPKSDKPKKTDAGGGNDDLDEHGDGNASGKPKPKSAKPAARPAVSQRPIDEEKLGASIAKGLSAVLAKPEEKKSAADSEVDPKEKRRLEVLFHMEQMPDFNGRYKGVVEQYKTGKRKLKEYAENWEKENPGQKFDEKDEQHTEAIDAIEAEFVNYDEDDYSEALADMRASKKFEASKSELEGVKKTIEQREKAAQKAPEVAAAADAAGNEFWNGMGEAFKEAVRDGAINGEFLEDLKKSDPDTHAIVVGAAAATEAAAAAIFALSNDLVQFNPKNELHAQLGAFALNRERAMMARPEEERLDDSGRAFATKAEFEKMSPEQREQHWTFSPEDLTYMVTQRYVKQAQQNLEAEEKKFERRAKAKGLLKDEETPPAGKSRSSKSAEDEDEDDSNTGQSGSRKPVSPSSFASPRMASSGGKKGGGPQTAVDRFVGKFLG